MHNYCNLFVAAVSSLVKKSHGLFNMAAIGEYSVQYCSFCFVFPFCLFAFFLIINLHIKGKKAIFFSVLLLLLNLPTLVIFFSWVALQLFNP